jgi:hypothetical protein
MLEMSGANASNLQFVVEAIFLGSATTRVCGKRVVISGPTGREPLVGLRIALERVSSAREHGAKSTEPANKQRKRVSAKPAQPKQSAADAERPQSESSAIERGPIPGRIRVFRSRAKIHRDGPAVV